MTTHDLQQYPVIELNDVLQNKVMRESVGLLWIHSFDTMTYLKLSSRHTVERLFLLIFINILTNLRFVF